ncbi:unnamed protein product [Rodentolepis nana]|uniref:Uncharacterized protein n=1 Tax=Rodentolepis nana TaxID=102285 RepID=A0A0R3TF43_RODNA|nr:unnamed protein product [Rodentolepis nana]
MRGCTAAERRVRLQSLQGHHQSLTGIGIFPPLPSIHSVIPFCSNDHLSSRSNDYHLTSAAVSHDKSDPDFRSTETPSLIGDAIVLHIALLI